MMAACSPLMAKHLGSYRVTPEWWKDQVREFLRAGRGRQEKMAAAIKCSSTAITEMLSPATPGKSEPDTSRIAARVAEWTGIPLGDDVADTLVGELSSEAERVLDINEEAVRGAIAVLRAVRVASEKSRNKERQGGDTPAHAPKRRPE